MHSLKAIFSATLMTLVVNLSTLYSADAMAADAVKLAEQKAAVIQNMHKKAQRAIVTAAQDKVFPAYFSSSDPAEKAKLKQHMDEVSLNVQSNFLVSEMCIIDASGTEHSRITGNVVAPESDLSSEEASAPFFKPAMALDAKQSATTSIYVSPDAGYWVVAYVSPIVIDGKKPAFVHYEHDLKKYRDLANKGIPEGSYLLMVSSDGYVFSDSRNEISLEGKDGAETEADYFKSLDQIGISGVAKVMSDIKSGTSGVADVTDDSGAKLKMAYQSTDSWFVVAVAQQ